jgi:Peptide methionine sulfoxide reductase
MSGKQETAILAGGCFWPAQELLRHRAGVISTRVGYTGGENDNPKIRTTSRTTPTARTSSLRSGASSRKLRSPACSIKIFKIKLEL